MLFRPFRVDGNRVRPDDVKITFVVNTTRIANFVSSGYKIALRAVVISATSRYSNDGTDSQELSISGDAMVKTGFNWAKSVNLTGAGLAKVQAAVVTEINAQYSNSTILNGFSANYTATRVTWSLATDAATLVNRSIEWDPAAAAAVDYAALDSTNTSAAASICFSVAGFLAAVIAVLAM